MIKHFEIGDYVVPKRGSTICKVTKIYYKTDDDAYYYTRSACGVIAHYHNEWRPATKKEIEVDWIKQHESAGLDHEWGNRKADRLAKIEVVEEALKEVSQWPEWKTREMKREFGV